MYRQGVQQVHLFFYDINSLQDLTKQSIDFVLVPKKDFGSFDYFRRRIERKNLPDWWESTIQEGTNIQTPYITFHYYDHFAKGPNKMIISAEKWYVSISAHEYLHTILDKYLGFDSQELNLPPFLSEGMNIYVGNQIQDDYPVAISPDISAALILKPGISIIEYDNRNLNENALYQWSGRFFRDLVKYIAESTTKTEKQVFQEIFLGLKDNQYTTTEHQDFEKLFDYESFFRQKYNVDTKDYFQTWERSIN